MGAIDSRESRHVPGCSSHNPPSHGRPGRKRRTTSADATPARSAERQTAPRSAARAALMSVGNGLSKLTGLPVMG
jgi:hypothetical protein